MYFHFFSIQFSILLNIWYFSVHLSNIVVHSCIKYPCGSVDIRLGPIGVENFVIFVASFHATPPLPCVKFFSYFSFIHITFLFLCAVSSFRWDWNLAMMNSVSLLKFISYFFCFLSHRKNENESTLHIHETESWLFSRREVVVWVREELYGFWYKAIRSIFIEFSITVPWKINMEIVANKIKDIDPWNIVLWKQLTANK